MKNIITITLVALVTLTACQKDYYLEDLESAQAQIEMLEGRIDNLIAQGKQDELEMNELNVLILNLQDGIDAITIELQVSNRLTQELSDKIDDLSTQLDNSKNEVVDLLNEIHGLNNDLEAGKVTQDNYLVIITELEEALELEKLNVKTITEYVEVIVTQTQVITKIVEVEVEVEVEADPIIQQVIVEVEVPSFTNQLILTPIEGDAKYAYEVTYDGEDSSYDSVSVSNTKFFLGNKKVIKIKHSYFETGDAVTVKAIKNGNPIKTQSFTL